MKMIHLSDLHLGKRVNEFSMIDDQRYILDEIIAVIDEEQPQVVVIAGDVYDKPVPPAEAVQLFDDFLTRLSRRGLQVMVISGNHDSAERIAFGAKLMALSGIHMSPVYDGSTTRVRLEDAYGPVNFYLLPFLKPVHVRRYYPDIQIDSYTDALRTAIEAMKIDSEERNVLVTHQFVTGAARCESEEISVGGSDNVDVSVFEEFDYVALGHIHGPQQIGRETVRYCGTPLKYSFSEIGHVKSVTVVEMEEKEKVHIRTVPLKPMHDMRSIRGTYAELTLRENYMKTDVDDYLRVVLTDEDDIYDALARLRTIYPNIMKLEYDNLRTRSVQQMEELSQTDMRSPTELFGAFYAQQNNQEMSPVQQEYVDRLFAQIGEERV